jgi:E1A/CREB-binding protein
MAKKIEEHLYRSAKTKEEYMDPKTLKKRLQWIAFELGVQKQESELFQEVGIVSTVTSVVPELNVSNTEKHSKQWVSFEAQQKIDRIKEQNLRLQSQQLRSVSIPFISRQDDRGTQRKEQEQHYTQDSNTDSKHAGSGTNYLVQLQKNLDDTLNSLSCEEETNCMMDSEMQRKKVIRQQQLRLYLLRHASKCTKGASCKTRYCPQMVKLWNHMKVSCPGADCQVPHCLSSRCVLNHYRICKDLNRTSTCEVCAPVMKYIRQEEGIEVKKLEQIPSGLTPSQEGISMREGGEAFFTPNIIESAEAFVLIKSEEKDVQLLKETQKAGRGVKLKHNEHFIEKSGNEFNQSDLGFEISAKDASHRTIGNSSTERLFTNEVTEGKKRKGNFGSFKTDDEPHSKTRNICSSSSFESKDQDGCSTKHLEQDDTDDLSNDSTTPCQSPTSSDEISSIVSEKCLPLLRKLISHQDGWVFKEPVDPVELGLPDYFDIIKTPMDLALIEKRLVMGQYKEFEEVQRDTELVFDNAILYNGEDSQVGELAQKLIDIFQADFERSVT